MPIFSQNGQLLIFRHKSVEIAQLRAISCLNIVEGVTESWVEAEMSWVEVGVSFSNTSLKLDLMKSELLKVLCNLFAFGFLFTIIMKNYDLLW